MFTLNGKVALITGGVHGIGLSIAKELLQNGVKGVALIDIDHDSGILVEEELSKGFPKGRVIYIKADVAQRSQFQDAFEKTIETFGQLDIVVNNAGILQELDWEKCIGVNLQGCVTGSILALDEYFPKTLGTSEGIILNVSSILGLMPAEFEPVYTATKHGVIGFSRSLSGPNRCRNLKVKVLTICPGLTSTNISALGKGNIRSDMDEHRKKLQQVLPWQTPEQLAKHVTAIMENGKTGSVWIINDNTKEEVNFPTLFKP